jgi:hypothetical protein
MADEPVSVQKLLQPDFVEEWPDTLLLKAANKQLDRFMAAPGMYVALDFVGAGAC